MTISQVLETVMSKIGAITGKFFNGTPFENKYTTDMLGEMLTELGYDKYGKEVVYNGETGEEMYCNMFIGSTFYQRLKHIADEKLHARSSGSVNKLTRQAPDGRLKNGGLRLGEMELNCLNSHGASTILKERMFDCADSYQCYVCNECNLIAEVNEEMKMYLCKGCENTSNFSKINLPYATKLLFNEIMAMNIVPRIKCKK